MLWQPCIVGTMRSSAASKPDTSTPRSLSSLILSLAASLLVLGFPLSTTARLLLVLVVSATIGSPIWLLHRRGSPICLAELLGAGCAIGLAMFGLLGLAFRGLTLNLVIMGLVVLGGSSLYRDWRRANIPILSLHTEDSIALGASPLLAMLPFHPKVLPFILIALAPIAVRPMRHRLTFIGTWMPSISVGTAGLGALITYRRFGISAPWRDTIELDIISDEATALGLHALGRSESLTVKGEAAHSHFLSFSSFGTASDLFGLPSFALVGAGGFALAICALACIVFSVACRSVHRRTIGWLAVILLLLQGSLAPLSFVVPAMRGGNALPMLWFALGVVIVGRVINRGHFWDHVWLAAAAIVVLLGKFHWGALFVTFVVATTALALIHSPIRLRLLSMVMVATLASYTTFALLMQGADSEPVSFAPRSNLLHGLAVVLLIRFMPSLIATVSSRHPMVNAHLMVTLLVAVGYGLLGSIYVYEYFFNGLAVLAALLIPPALAGILIPELRSFQVIASGFVSCVAGLLFGLHHLIVIGEFRYGSRFDLGLFERPVFISAALLVSFVAIIAATSLRLQSFSSKTILGVAAVTSISLSFGILLALSMKPIVHLVSHSRADFPKELITPEQIKIGEWLRELTGKDDVLASNSLCRIDIRLGDVIPTNDADSGCGDRNVNAWIPALSRRQMLISSPAYGPLAFRQVRDSRHVDAYRASLEFGNSGDERSLKILQDFGVGWFLVDLRNSTNTEWLRDREIVFQSPNFAVLRVLGDR